MPASHDTIVRSIQAIAAPHIGADRAAIIGGHDQRHTAPEIGRAAKIPRHLREALGYWRSAGEVSDAPEDLSATARAITAARKHKSKQGHMAWLSDRYASVDAQAIEQDQTRATCIQLAARVLSSNSVPTTSREQLERVANLVE